MQENGNIIGVPSDTVMKIHLLGKETKRDLIQHNRKTVNIRPSKEVKQIARREGGRQINVISKLATEVEEAFGQARRNVRSVEHFYHWLSNTSTQERQ